MSFPIDFTLVKRKPSRNLILLAKCKVTYSLIRKREKLCYTTCVSDVKGHLDIVADDMHKRSYVCCRTWVPCSCL